MQNYLNLVVCTLLVTQILARHVPVTSVKYKQKTGKTVPIFAERETSIFTSIGAPGIITNMFFGGQFGDYGGQGYRDTILRVYVDGEMEASIEATLYNLHGFLFWCREGDSGKQTPIDGSCTRTYDNSWIGKTAANSGHYNTFRIPFGPKGIRITLQAPSIYQGRCTSACDKDPGASTCCGIYYHISSLIAQGPEYIVPSIVLGDLVELPPDARLRLYSTSAPYLESLDFQDIYDVNGGVGGALLWVGMAARIARNVTSTFPAAHKWRFMEGCMRVSIDGEEEEIISDGTESFFYGSLYFDEGRDRYSNSIAGLQQFIDTNKTSAFSAYRFFDSEALIHHNSMKMTWRNGAHNQCKGSSRTPALYGPVPPVEMHAVVMAYNWKSNISLPHFQ